MEPLSKDQRHELLTPLTAIQGYAELLKNDSDKLTKQQLLMLEHIQKSVDKLHAMINNQDT